MGFRIYATERTAEALHSAGLDNISVLHKVKEIHMNPNILEHLQKRKIDLIINIPNANNQDKHSEILEDEYIIRRLAVEFGIPVVTNLELASALIKVLKHHNYNVLTVRSLNEYMNDSTWKFW